MPFSQVNPYAPFTRGQVPAEMFFGRVEMAISLQEPTGACIVYGGRQLGKSALLRHVEREFDYPEQMRHAAVIDIRYLEEPVDIWPMIRDRLKEMKLISNRIVTKNTDQIVGYVLEAMRHNPQLRLLLMFDEADSFLDADSEEGRFTTVTRLRGIMEETGNRFKVVFAGLHSVQRFQAQINQPLAHFGVPVCVGPLEPGAAQQLIREPLEILGYRVSQEQVLRILSYTNNHPMLIQLFCQTLVDQLKARPPSGMPPHEIERRRVDDAYLDPSFRNEIQVRFNLTLSLDLRYRAIALTLIDDQAMDRDSYSKDYAPSDIMSLGRNWWPQGFNPITNDYFRGLLDEMVGLGVLVRSTNGRYRIRSPNTARLIGSDSQIASSLEELRRADAPSPSDSDSYHTPQDEKGTRYGVLSNAQGRRLKYPGSGVGILFAAESMGLVDLPDELKRLTSREEAMFDEELDDQKTNGRQAQSRLSVELATHEDQRMFCYRRPRLDQPEELAGLVESALSDIQSRSVEAPWARVLFVLDPLSTKVWLDLAKERRRSLEDRCDAVVRIERWNGIAVGKRLMLQDRNPSPQAISAINESTGGWPLLIRELFDEYDWGDEDDPAQACSDIINELMDGDSALRNRFQESLGLDTKPVARALLDGLARLETDLGEAILPDFITADQIFESSDGYTEDDIESALEFLETLSIVHRDDHNSVIVDPVVRKAFSLP